MQEKCIIVTSATHTESLRDVVSDWRIFLGVADLPKILCAFSENLVSDAATGIEPEEIPLHDFQFGPIHLIGPA
jgi:hypothetical protein